MLRGAIRVPFPTSPGTIPSVDVLPKLLASVIEPTPHDEGELDIRVATCNVLSLRPPGKSTDPTLISVEHSGPVRQDVLLQQFHEAGIQLFALQETRVRRLSNRHDQNYWLFRSQATAQGHIGITVGIHKNLPIGRIYPTNKDSSLHERRMIVQEKEVAIISACPLRVGHEPNAQVVDH